MRCSAVHLLVAAVLLFLNLTRVTALLVSMTDRLPSDVIFRVELLPDGDEAAKEGGRAAGDQVLQMTSWNGEAKQQQPRILLQFHLRKILSGSDRASSGDSNDTSMAGHLSTGSGEGSGDCSYEHFTAWPMAADRLPPGALSACRERIFNGTLPLNETHAGHLELYAASPPSPHQLHRLYVTPLRSRLGRWQQLDRMHRSLQEPDTTIVWPTERPLRRVRRSRRWRSFKYRARDPRRFKVRDAKVSFNLQSRFLTKLGPFIIQLHLYLDTDLSKKFYGNLGLMIHRAKESVNFANALLRPFNTYIMISSLHLPVRDAYGGQPPVFGHRPITFLHSEYLENAYAGMTDKEVDCVFAFLGRDHMNYTLSGSDGFPCDSNRIPSCVGFVIMETNRANHTRTVGLALAHELAHRFGVKHDPSSPSEGDKNCPCEFPRCVMSDTSEPVSTADAAIGWSNCSSLALARELDHLARGKACLTAKLENPGHSAEVFKTVYAAEIGATCGNGIVEPGEECDCGDVRGCRANVCCQGSTCRLSKGAKCAWGACCNLTTCQVRVKNSLCRPADDPRCDFPEVCDGSSPDCPPDVSVLANWPCGQGDLVSHRCFRRHCMPPRRRAKYRGPSCQAKGTVPSTAGGCKARYVPPQPPEKPEDYFIEIEYIEEEKKVDSAGGKTAAGGGKKGGKKGGAKGGGGGVSGAEGDNGEKEGRAVAGEGGGGGRGGGDGRPETVGIGNEKDLASTDKEQAGSCLRPSWEGLALGGLAAAAAARWRLL